MIFIPDSKEIQVELQGGLGNQLFGWSCGYAVSQKLSLELNLDISRLTQHGFQLDSLDHGGRISSAKEKRLLSPLKNFQEASFMYDERIKSIKSPTRLRGYFQSWKYFSEFSSEIRKIVNNSLIASPYAQNILSKIDSMNLNVVHIRRGDYTNLQNYHGLTSINYYKRARKLLNHADQNSKYIVFSDDIQIASDVWPDAEIYVSKSQVPSSLENLLLMSKGKNFIGSNSSFSWWAAYINSEQGLKIFPRPWFSSLVNDTRDLLLPDWLTLGNEPVD